MLLLLLFASPISLVLATDPSLRRVFSNSRAFSTHQPHPISRTTTLEYLFRSKHVKESDVQKYIQSTRIVAHPTVRQIAIDFLTHKRTHGTKTEKKVYAEQIEWDVERFFARLIRQRPLSFYRKGDTTLLRNHKHLISATSAWDRVGSDNEHHDIPIEYYLTYEEMMVLSLIGVSGYTPYLNDGNRYNRGVAGTPEPTQPEGVHIGLVGARFKRRGRMDSVYAGDPEFWILPLCVLLPRRTFRNALQSKDPDHRRDPITRSRAERIGSTQKSLCAFSRPRARCMGRAPWSVAVVRRSVHSMPGWAEAQVDWRAWVCTLTQILPLRRTWKSQHTLGFQCVFNLRAPSARLKDQSLLLVVSYAWDANSYPGNEFYCGLLDASGDPAAACSSVTSETQNPKINTAMLKANIIWPE